MRLDVLPADSGTDGKHAAVALVRKKISMEEQSAKKSIIEVRENGVKRRVGVISLPTFYQDFDARRKGDKDFKSATRDVARILGELKKEKVDNVLIDLRNNGGGSLTEAVELTGLFIDKGPVVQQRTADGKVEVESDTNAGPGVGRPGRRADQPRFGVGVGNFRRRDPGLRPRPDHRRAELRQGHRADRCSTSTSSRRTTRCHYGELKMTIAQFFRINGGTTQLRGVTPDIKLPVTADAENFGESSYDNALPWVSIKPASYVPSGDLKELFAPLQKRHDVRIAKDKDFQYLQEDIAEMRKLRKENAISLNEAVRRKERDTQDARAKLREARLAAQAPADDASPAPTARKRAASCRAAKTGQGAGAERRGAPG